MSAVRVRHRPLNLNLSRNGVYVTCRRSAARPESHEKRGSNYPCDRKDVLLCLPSPFSFPSIGTTRHRPSVHSDQRPSPLSRQVEHERKPRTLRSFHCGTGNQTGRCSTNYPCTNIRAYGGRTDSRLPRLCPRLLSEKRKTHCTLDNVILALRLLKELYGSEPVWNRRRGGTLISPSPLTPG